MNMSGSGGFLLHAIKVYDDPSASSVLLYKKPKKPKQEAADAMDQNNADVSHERQEDGSSVLEESAIGQGSNIKTET